MSKELVRAIKVLDEILEIPKGVHEDYINVGILIAKNTMLIELNNKEIKELKLEMENIEEQINSIEVELEKDSQEKQGL